MKKPKKHLFTGLDEFNSLSPEEKKNYKKAGKKLWKRDKMFRWFILLIAYYIVTDILMFAKLVPQFVSIILFIIPVVIILLVFRSDLFGHNDEDDLE